MLENDERCMKDEQCYLQMELLECYQCYKENSMKREQYKNRCDELTEKIKAVKGE